MTASELILKRAESGQMNNMLEVRAAGQRWAQLKVALIQVGRGHVRHSARRLLNKPPATLADRADLVGELRAAHLGYTRAVNAISALGTECGAWTSDNISGKIGELLASDGLAQSALTALAATYSRVSSEKQLVVAGREKQRRSAAASAGRVIKPYVDKGLSPNWANWFVSLGLIKSDPDGPCTYNASVDDQRGDVSDFSRPMWFSETGVHVGVALSEHRVASTSGEVCV